jgi:uncharacterized protein (TIGR03435 family)
VACFALSLLLLASGHAKAQTFEAASVHSAAPGSHGWYVRDLPGGRFRAENVPLFNLVVYAFRTHGRQVVGLPAWAKQQRFTIDAVAPEAVARLAPAALEAADAHMLQELLKKRFHMKAHWTTKNLAVYQLQVGKAPAKLQPADAGSALAAPTAGAGQPDLAVTGPGSIEARGATLASLAAVLTDFSDRVVQDRTGLTGKFDFMLSWAWRADVPGLPLRSAVEAQLGLEMVPAVSEVRVLSVDHVTLPGPN